MNEPLIVISRKTPPTITTENQKVIDALKASGGKFIDGHATKGGRLFKHVTKVIVLTRLERDGETVTDWQYVCAAYEPKDTPCFSLNPIVIGRDKKLHLLRGSVGAVVDLITAKSLKEEVENMLSKKYFFSPDYLEIIEL